MPQSLRFRPLVPLVVFGYALALTHPALCEPNTHSSKPAEATAAPETTAPDGEPDAAAAPSPLAAHQQEVLRKALHDAETDRAATSTLMPWLLTGVGAALILTGLSVALGSSLGCGHHCEGGPAAIPWIIVGGATAGTLGTIWLVTTRRDIADIESREYRIKTELERIDWNNSPLPPEAALGPRLTLRGTF